VITSRKLRWAEHVALMDGIKIHRKILFEKPGGREINFDM
jgi:hypothetical protein